MCIYLFTDVNLNNAKSVNVMQDFLLNYDTAKFKYVETDLLSRELGQVSVRKN